MPRQAIECAALTESSASLTRAEERLALAALTFAGFAIAVNVQVLAALGPYLSIADDEFGNLVGAGWIGSALGALALLPVVDRVGRRAPMIWGLCAFAVASAGHVVVDGYLELLVVRFVAGLAGGALFSIASATVADLVPYERRSVSMGVFNLSIFLAVPVGMPLAIVLARADTPMSIFGLQAVVAILAVFGLLRTIPAGLGKDGAALQWRVLTEPHVGAAIVSMMLYSGAFASTVQLLGRWLADDGIVDREQQMWVWFGLGLLGASGTFTLSRLSDRVGKLRFVVLLSFVVGLGMLALRWVQDVTWLAILGVPIALCAPVRSGAMMAVTTGLVPSERRGSLMLIRTTAVNAAMGVMALVVGQLDAAYGFGAVLVVGASCVGLSGLLAGAFVREVGR